jgi:uncharacterized 2Fe-2S/4Fe-4S cluster protein (DUF4445 family)
MATLSINGVEVAAAPGASIFELAESAGVHVPTSCRKQGKCKECIVEVVEGADALSPRTEPEEHLRGSFRLSCQTSIAAPDALVRAHTMRRGAMQIVDSHVAQASWPARKLYVKPESYVNPEPRPGGQRRSSYGLALDLGTTTVVLRLVDLRTGELVATSSFENPQRFGGSEIMSRIQYDTDHRGKLLMRTLAGYLTHAIEEFPVSPQEIGEMVVVGNSTMRDLFFGLNVYTIGQNPYRSITEIDVEAGKRATTSLLSSGRQCLLPIHPEARVWGAPIISGHVGADAAACMLAADLANEDRLVAIMDIGTNTELIVGNRRRMMAASCPAGPAFEGGGVACGMPALPGAVEDVTIDEHGEFRLSVIGGGAPEGICGSGLVKLLSELLRTGRMNDMGRFTDGASRIEIASGVYFLESDVNELAQAKGANAAGLQTVFSEYGIDFDEIEVFYLAGGFGRHIDIAAAQRIGLIPDLPASRVVQAGNASIEGATIALLSEEKRGEMEAMARRVAHCRLETHPRFFDFFVEGCQFKPVESLREAALWS